MARIVRTFSVPATGSYYCEDIDALRREHAPEDQRWSMPGVSDGYRRIREIAEALSIGLVLDTGDIVWGDALGVSYSGKAGREPVFRARTQGNLWKEKSDRLVGVSVDSFRENTPLLEDLGLPTGLRYGLSQALLAATAIARKRTPTEVLCEEWNLPLPGADVPLQGSCGNNRFENVDKMIAHRLEVLPHTQVENVESQFGKRGEILVEYAGWLRHRIAELGGPHYAPVIHLDVHGAVGKVFGMDYERATQWIASLADACYPYALRLESPYVEQSLSAQFEVCALLRKEIRSRSLRAELVMDEWVNSIQDIQVVASQSAADRIHIKMPNFGSIHRSLEAVLLCRELGLGTLLGGSCVETDLSSKISVHVALASRPDVLLVKPGMGINEAVSMMKNEMGRTLEVLGTRVRGEECNDT